MSITNDDVCLFTRAIWESTLGLQVQPMPASTPLDVSGRSFVGKAQISGAYQGTVLLECSEKLAKLVARAMFGLDSEEPTSEELRDALAEITNVTAGNLKSLVLGECHLSAPEVAEGGPAAPIAPDQAVVCRQVFACQNEPFVVTLLDG